VYICIHITNSHIHAPFAFRGSNVFRRFRARSTHTFSNRKKISKTPINSFPHIWMSHVTHLNKSGQASDWGMSQSHIRRSHVTHPSMIRTRSVYTFKSKNICQKKGPSKNFALCTHKLILPPQKQCSVGWLRFVGFLKWWVSFAKEPYKRDCILQKRPMILRSLLIVATPKTMQNIKAAQKIAARTLCTHSNHIQMKLEGGETHRMPYILRPFVFERNVFSNVLLLISYEF